MVVSLPAVVLTGALAASPRVLHDGFEVACDVDSDADRLPNCVEIAMQTARFDPDTDGDGLSDGDEALGTAGGLDLPGLGAQPRRRDVLLELDWVEDNAGCGLHSHRPSPAVVAQVQAFFAGLPLANPDGSSGINLIVDYGQGPPFTGGNRVNAPASGNVSSTQLQLQYQPVYFASNRLGYFRYSIHAHHLAAGQYWGGVAVGDAHLVTLGCAFDASGYQRNTMIHELGHNFGLQHGGDIACERKPNYNSLMNYNYAFNGIDIDCDRFPDGIDQLGFSDGRRNTLSKSSLIEADGVCAADDPQAKPIDWNFNGVIDAAPVAVDLACPGIEVLRDWNDLAAMRLPLETLPGAVEPPPALPGEVCPPIPQP